MPRTLPWLAQGTQPGGNKQYARSSSLTPRRKRTATPDDIVDEDLNSTSFVMPEKRQKRKQSRSPSSSPPPAPPPEVEYMREGYAGDDIWIMVEDELYSTAQMFTQHIHHAAYVELKKKAKARGKDTLKSIVRLTDGRTEQTAEVRLRKEREERDRKVQRLYDNRQMKESDEEEEDDYMHDPLLSGLMAGSQRVDQQLASMPKVKSNTRAAAGFTKSPQKPRPWRDVEPEDAFPSRKAVAAASSNHRQGNSSEEDDGDLDAKPKQPSRVTSKPKVSYNKIVKEESSTPMPSTAKHLPKHQGLFKRFREAPIENDREERDIKRETDVSNTNENQTRPFSALAESPPPKTASGKGKSEAEGAGPRTNGFLAMRKARKEKQKREGEEKAKNDVAIATFAF
ncbi:hypothetical protein KC340_g4133 [Hortaea werneckii]|nr:hypothetical protein KC342_g4790 [Hortaea werneckii]KAI7101823.1 hypothetical protein KC339_g6459 [Hortaea werneckii]KAI7243197.1 hypothetical protein KC365_g2483 [Hortaea werneckii]KAI7330588.1 hypothetical protein KC340_g4133 [Hortaea werneckii]KAI7379677.1 hypothetical protein KC328_g13191 [Hortaea werneckii]